ncbi:MAG: hypothetical protein KME20_13595 [Kaiparowitsia implicata GSE-PSE-MK54-09C]|jgi:hypothetical protein|nr:hypothetical protein [Kaiparowitsia implicata GSE-PSE-MK54-09C]
MDSNELAQFIEHTGSAAKPWLLAQLRLKKLQEQRPHLSPEDYAKTLEEINQSLLALGDWWEGREDDVF